MVKNKQNCAELTAQVLSVMRDDNYSYSVTDRKLIYIYRALTKLCEAEFDGFYTVDAGVRFLDINKDRNLCAQQWRGYGNAIKRLDSALNGEFHWRPVLKEQQAYASSCFNGVILEYEKHLVNAGKSEPDIRNRIHVLARFLAHAESSGITKINSITAKVLYSGYESEGSKDEYRKSVSSFLRYAYRNGLADEDTSRWMPENSRHKPVPTVYSRDEISTILASVDRSAAPGRRNYCIILIAARLGLRSCDIAGLTFENIHRDSNTIRLIQKKTGEPVEFPLLPEIQDSLDDYIDNERPMSELPYIFVSVPRPDVARVKAGSIYAAVSRIIGKSGVDTHNKRRGAHALRSSLATQLLEEGNSFSVIQKVLGHTSPEAARHYVKADIGKLKECALEIPWFHSGEIERYIREAGVCKL